MPCVIRHATPADAAAVSAFMVALATPHHGADPGRYTDVQQARTEYQRLIPLLAISEGDSSRTTVEDRSLLWLVAEDDAHAIRGYLLAEQYPADDLVWSPEHVCIHDLYVDERARKSGIARDLMLAARDWAASRNVRQLRLFTDARNEPARVAFERMGFRRTMVEMAWDVG